MAMLQGLGHFLPAPVERAGVYRPLTVDPVGPSTLAIPAARSALAQAGRTEADVEFIVFATMTPNVTFPGAGCYFQHEMGCPTVGALDVRAQCSGFLYGLVIADRFLRSGTYRNVLLLAAEVHSSSLDYTERGASIARLYGDGAAAALLTTATEGKGVLAANLHSDGRRHREFWCEYPASRQHPVRMTIENYRAGGHLLSLDLDKVRSFGVEAMRNSIDEALAQAGVRAADIDHFVLAHVLPDVAEQLASQSGIAAARYSNPSATHGHLTAAALPVGLSEALASGVIAPGATVCLATAGAGFTWGAAVLKL